MSVAIVSGGRAFSYRELDAAAGHVAASLLAGHADLSEARVAFVAQPGFEYVAILLGIWRAGGIAVPLATSHPPAEHEHVIRDSGASIVIADSSFGETLRPIADAAGATLTRPADLFSGSTVTLPEIADTRRALMLYTSGTTGKPKGVVTTHANVTAQIGALVSAWEWTSADRILLTLPLHHVHGIINGVGSSLRSGAICEMLPRFDAVSVWDRLASGDVSIFTAVPTMYGRLIAAWELAPTDRQRAWSAGAGRLRLMMSGSAALPVRTLERWREITGHTLLERYGMTEIGMGLSNPLHGERRPGFVGMPLPGVSARVVDESGNVVAPGESGELEIRGAGVFLEYWNRPDETRAAFREGWFRTGDVAVVEDSSYRLLGRTSIDIIKTGGYKVSALEIEEVLRTHPAIADCAVVGADDPDWGQRISAAVELRDRATLTLDELQRWAKPLLAPYKIPKSLVCVSALTRNAMGKVVKQEVPR